MLFVLGCASVGVFDTMPLCLAVGERWWGARGAGDGVRVGLCRCLYARLLPGAGGVSVDMLVVVSTPYAAVCVGYSAGGHPVRLGVVVVRSLSVTVPGRSLVTDGLFVSFVCVFLLTGGLRLLSGPEHSEETV